MSYDRETDHSRILFAFLSAAVGQKWQTENSYTISRVETAVECSLKTGATKYHKKQCNLSSICGGKGK